jgi:hypothetical protein
MMSKQTLKDIKHFVVESIKKTKQRIRMCRHRDVLQLQPHIKLLILDQINFSFSLLSDKDRRALIHDLMEQQKVIDAKKLEEHRHK